MQDCLRATDAVAIRKCLTLAFPLLPPFERFFGLQLYIANGDDNDCTLDEPDPLVAIVRYLAQEVCAF